MIWYNSYFSESRIAMTVPVANTFGPKEENPQNITMHFFLTESENPKPNNPDVFLTSYPTLKVYVRFVLSFPIVFLKLILNFRIKFKFTVFDIFLRGCTLINK